jgi:peptidoglycan/LPS O-acetylase OafA/YrhL
VALCFLFGKFPFHFNDFWTRNLNSVAYVWVFPFFVSVFRGKVWSKIFTNSWIVVFGGMCYTIYLIHYPILFFVCQVISPWLDGFSSNFWNVYGLFLLITLPVLALTSSLFFYFFEKPFMYKDWPEKWLVFFKNRFRKLNT